MKQLLLGKSIKPVGMSELWVFQPCVMGVCARYLRVISGEVLMQTHLHLRKTAEGFAAKEVPSCRRPKHQEMQPLTKRPTQALNKSPCTQTSDDLNTPRPSLSNFFDQHLLMKSTAWNPHLTLHTLGPKRV